MASPFSVSPNGDAAAAYCSSSPFDALTALHRYLPSNNSDYDDCDVTVNAFSCDHFRMYEFKVRKCAREVARLDGVSVRPSRREGTPP